MNNSQKTRPARPVGGEGFICFHLWACGERRKGGDARARRARGKRPHRIRQDRGFACDWVGTVAQGVVKTMNVRAMFCNALRLIGAGLVMAAILAVPVFNLLTPRFGTAFMERIARNIMRSAR